MKLKAIDIFNLSVIIFVLGCFFGAIGEEIFYGFVSLFTTGEWIWSSRSGLMYGNLAPLYGVGMLIAMLILENAILSQIGCLYIQ